MNHKIRLLAAVPVLAIAACGPTSTHHHVNIHATPTSTTVQQGEADAKALIAKCLGAQPSTTTLLLTFSQHGAFNRVSACLKITDPQSFELAVRDSFVTWGEAKGFDTKDGRTAWLFSTNTLVTPGGTKVPSFYELLRTYSK